MPLSEAELILGKRSRVFTDPNEIVKWGTIRNKSAIEVCNLHMFPHLGIPHRWILIYEDKTKTVKYVTLKSM